VEEGETGGRTAVPVAKQVFDYWLNERWMKDIWFPDLRVL